MLSLEVNNDMVEEGPKSHQEINSLTWGVRNVEFFQQCFDAIVVDEIFL